MYTKSQIKKMISLDIETASSHETYEDFLSERPLEDKFWNRKTITIKKGDPVLLDNKTDSELYESHSAIYPEFGRIVCISVGQIKFDEDDNTSFLKKSFYGEDEKQLLEEFINFARAMFNKVPDIQFLGHNIKVFDLPYILKRCMIHQIKIPTRFHLHDIKPWENCLLDTMNIWRFGGRDNISLEHLTFLLKVKNPKEADVYQQDHGGIARAFWNGKIEELKDYCEEDIEATANLLLRLSNFNPTK